VLTSQIGLGIASLALAFALLWIGMPDKQGESPKFLRFEAALVTYPALILVFFAIGMASLLSIWLGIS
jgi:hypothetical protein